MSNPRNELMALVDQIPDPGVKVFTQVMLEDHVPAHFWYKESSAGKYHPSDEHGKYGLLIHSIRVVKVGMIICDSRPELNRSVVMSSCTLHDMCRFGDVKKPAPYTLKSHPDLAAFIIREEGTDIIPEADAIAHAVETHMGRWGNIKPDNKTSWTVHLADNIASKMHTL